MKFFQRRSLNQLQAIFAFKYHSKTHFKGHLKPPKANQALQGYLNSNCTRQVLSFFREILRENPSTIDSFSFLYVLKACIQKSTFLEGKQLHALVIKFGFEFIIHLQTLLVNVYSVTGNLFDAHQVFDEMPVRNMVCWTALISAYVDNQRPGKALQLFRQMQMDNVEPDKVTLTVTLSACADLGALEMGEWIHAFIRRKQGFSSDLGLNNAFINMYAKCGDMKKARRLFDSIKKKDVTTWTSLMVGHALHGEAKEALELFEEMKAMNTNPRKRNSGCSSSSILPNHVTFLGVLMACSHAGMIDVGKHHFRSMSKDYGLNPRDSHFGCMVDLFCRAGQLEEAYDFISAMPVQPNAVVWRTLLGACSLQGNIKLGQEVRCKLLELEPNYVGDCVAMSNIFAAKGMWDEKMVAREQIMQRRAPGCSSIEVGSGISEFVASAFDHPLSDQICEVLRNLTVTMRAYGYCLEVSSLKEY